MIPRYYRPVAAVLASLLVLVAVLATGCSSSPSATAIAVVNSVEIPKSAVDSQIAQMKKASPASFEGTTGVQVEQQYRAQILNSLIQLELIKESAKSLNVTVTTKQVDDYVAQLQTQYGGATALNTAMASAGFTMATLREQINNNLLATAVGDKVVPTSTVNVTDAQVKAYYDQNKAQYATPAQVHAEHILVSTTSTVLAQSLFKQVKAGGDFAALAKKYSTDPGSSAKGGDLGWASASAYVTEFANAVSKMKVNDVQLVKSQYGWHIIKLLGHRAAAQQTLAEATAAIRQTLEQTARSNAFSTYLQGLQAKAKITILDANLKKIIDANTAQSASSTSTAQ
jgi:foldase protein PrsA